VASMLAPPLMSAAATSTSSLLAAQCSWGLRVRATRDWGVGVGAPADEQINYCRTVGKISRPISGDMQRGVRPLVALEPDRRQFRMLVKETRERVNVTSADCLDQRYGEDIVTGQSWHNSSSPPRVR
jgi:hypothetical protein